MEILEGLATRRSVYSFGPKCPDIEDVKVALDVAVLAPNHFLTKPWRFAVFSGEGRAVLAEALGKAAQRLGRPVNGAKAKPYTSPIQILVGVQPNLDHPKVVEQEEMLAVGAAIQNLMLGLHDKGVGSIWTTGPIVDSQEVKDHLGWTRRNDRVVGLIYVGYPEGEKAIPTRRKTTFETVTQWYG